MVQNYVNILKIKGRGKGRIIRQTFLILSHHFLQIHAHLFGLENVAFGCFEDSLAVADPGSDAQRAKSVNALPW